ncbi:MAG: DUF624 domain-containing protein [Lachnospiraceae bacterium]|nr:DUF624 domain-containing protein [Lachnospiraceae bacterium]
MLDRMFNYENPVWQFMGRIADLMILNAMALIFSVPIITIGASWTALYYCTVKIVRKEDTYVWKEFWNSFKSNFKQATIIWLILIPFLAILFVDVLMWYNDPTLLPKVLKVTTVIVICIVLAITVYVFPILSHFDNTTRNTLKNAFLVSMINIPYTLYFMFLLFLPIVIVWIDLRFMMLDMLMGISLPALLASFGWSRIFKKLEPPKQEEDEEDSQDPDSIVKEAEKELIASGADVSDTDK